MIMEWTRASALQAVETGVISVWAGSWLLREQPVDGKLGALLRELQETGKIRRDSCGRYVVVRAGGPR